MDFYETYPYEYSTTNETVIDDLITSGKAKILKKHSIKMTTLDFLLENIKNLDLLTIDAEGMDYEILNSWDFKKIRPEVICIEDHDFKHQNSKINDILKFQNYMLEKELHPSYIYKDKH